MFLFVSFAAIIILKNSSRETTSINKVKTKNQPHTSANHISQTKQQNFDLATKHHRQDGESLNIDLNMDPPLEALDLDTWSDKMVKLFYADGSIFETAKYLCRDQVPPKELNERLLSEMNSKFPNVREMCLKIAMLVPVDSILPVFEKGLEDSSPKVRVTAILGVNAMGIYNDAILESMRELLNTETEPRVQREVCAFFNTYPSQIGDSEAKRLSKIMKRNSEAGIIAGWALTKCEIGADEIVENLRTIYENGKQSSGVGLAVALSAGAVLAKQEILDHSVKEIFLSNLSYNNGTSQRDNAFVRSSCIIGLTNYSDDIQVQDSICKLLQNENNILVFKTIKGFCSSSSSSQVKSVLSEKLDSFSDDIRYTPHRIEIAGALAKIGKKEGIETLGVIIADWNQMPVVKTMALGELRRVTQRYFGYPLFGGTFDQKVDVGNKWIQFFTGQNYD